MSVVELSREERDALIVELRGRGLSLSDIGRRVGLSGTRVGRILGSGAAADRTANLRTGPQRVEHRCATPGCCSALKAEHYIYSSHTGDRYCYPGEGCWAWSDAKRKRMLAANVAPKPEAVEA